MDKTKKYSTLNVRHTGKSTRLADHYIQVLFTVGLIVVKDDMPDIYNSNLYLFNRIKKRLLSEHPTTVDKISFDEASLTISLKDELLSEDYKMGVFRDEYQEMKRQYKSNTQGNNNIT